NRIVFVSFVTVASATFVVEGVYAHLGRTPRARGTVREEDRGRRQTTAHPVVLRRGRTVRGRVRGAARGDSRRRSVCAGGYPAPGAPYREDCVVAARRQAPVDRRARRQPRARCVATAGRRVSPGSRRRTTASDGYRENRPASVVEAD